ncbi:MAG: T9SS type A sorting domain-containing protein [Bacteroidetes bacterium]|nr:T9SS type A sorting domain-containing protein [Bacteroidota bacterium]MBU1796961.1 T9SS type A sorting domain-containing protein [Bacteroidota bacterium]
MGTHLFIKKVFIFNYFLIYGLLFPASPDSLSLNVVSYNIQTGGYYRTETPQLLAQFVEDWKVDILGTQELHKLQVEAIDKALPEFSWFGVGREDGKDFGETSVIFYRKEKFELLEQSTFWLSETPDVVGSKSWSSSDIRIVTWGKFLDRSIEKTFYVFNTHYDHISDYARTESSKLLRLKMREIAGLNPIIITGDFNCTAGTTPYNLIIEENKDDLLISNSEKICLDDPFGPKGSFNDFKDNSPTLKIDFIFVNQFFKTLKCGIINEKPNDKFISDHFPVFAKMEFTFPTPPIRPVLNAIACDNQVNLIWDRVAEDSTYETFFKEGNDFQGYKLYRSKDPKMKDAVLVEDSWNIPLLRKPILVSDKIDGIKGYTNYGIINGFGYFLGEDSGLQHFYSDYNVTNGVTYYYVLTSYDDGFSGIGTGFAPSECSYEIEVDESGNLLYNSQNTAIVTPKKSNSGVSIPSIIKDSNNSTIGNESIIPRIFDTKKITEKETYKIKFLVDTLEYHELNNRYRHKNDLLYSNSGFAIYKNDNTLVYKEDMNSYAKNNIVFDKILNKYFLNSNELIISEEFEGIQITMDYKSRTAQYSKNKSGWIKGEADMQILPSKSESKFFPWQYEIIFTDNSDEYTGLTNKVKGIRSHDDLPLGPAALLLNEKFNFYVLNKSFQLNDGTYEKLDLIVHDKNQDGIFNRENDQVLVGHSVTLANQILWAGTVFAIDFSLIKDELSMPQPNNIYLVDFDRPYMETDVIKLNVDPKGKLTNNNPIPDKFSLKQNYPNPFNPITTIEFSIAQEGKYSLKVYNIIGQIVSTLYDKSFGAGNYSATFSSAGLSSGVYIYRLDGPVGSIANKMIILK